MICSSVICSLLAFMVAVSATPGAGISYPGKVISKQLNTYRHGVRTHHPLLYTHKPQHGAAPRVTSKPRR